MHNLADFGDSYVQSVKFIQIYYIFLFGLLLLFVQHILTTLCKLFVFVFLHFLPRKVFDPAAPIVYA